MLFSQLFSIQACPTQSASRPSGEQSRHPSSTLLSKANFKHNCFGQQRATLICIGWFCNITLQFSINVVLKVLPCIKKFSDQEILEKSPSDKSEMKEEVLVLIISAALTAIVYVLIAFIKKFIRSRPPGRRLVTSDIQVEHRNTKFRGNMYWNPICVPGPFLFRWGYYQGTLPQKRTFSFGHCPNTRQDLAQNCWPL